MDTGWWLSPICTYGHMLVHFQTIDHLSDRYGYWSHWWQTLCCSCSLLLNSMMSHLTRLPGHCQGQWGPHSQQLWKLGKTEEVVNFQMTHKTNNNFTWTILNSVCPEFNKTLYSGCTDACMCLLPWCIYIPAPLWKYPVWSSGVY